MSLNWQDCLRSQPGHIPFEAHVFCPPEHVGPRRDRKTKAGPGVPQAVSINRLTLEKSSARFYIEQIQ